MTLTFKIQKQLIRRTDLEIPVANSKNYLYAEFEFSSEWTGAKTAIFNNGTAYEVILEDNKCLVPWEVITPQGFSVSVFCGDRITANKAFVQVLASGYQEGETPEPPTPTVYEQIIAKQDDLEEDIADLNDAVDDIRDDYATKAELTAGLATKQNKGDYATKTELSGGLAEKQDKGDYLEPENIIAGDNVTVTKSGKNVTISAQASGGTSDYEELENLPRINSVELKGNKSLADLGIQPAGSYATNTDLSGEETARQNADNALQGQINNKIEASNIKAGANVSVTRNGNDVTISASSGGTVDTSMSDSSTNAVQNKVIKGYVDNHTMNILHTDDPDGIIMLADLDEGIYMADGIYSLEDEDEGTIFGTQKGFILQVREEPVSHNRKYTLTSEWGIEIAMFDGTEWTYGGIPNDIDVQDMIDTSLADYAKKPKTFSNITVATSDWVADSTYASYGYKAVITCQGVTATDIADVYLAPASAALGIIAPFCVEGSGKITLYATEAAAITIDKVVAF